MSETRCSWATIHYYKLYCRISHLRLFAEKLLLVSNIKKKNNNDAVDFTSVCKEFQEGGREGQREREREGQKEMGREGQREGEWEREREGGRDSFQNHLA